MTNENRAKSNRSPLQRAELRDLYRRYEEFMSRIAEVRGRPINVRSFEGFAAWWEVLDPQTRAQCESDYVTGYDQLIKDAEEPVAEAIRKHMMRAG